MSLSKSKFWYSNNCLCFSKYTVPFQIKFTTDYYLQMYQTLQLFTNTFTFIASKFTGIKVNKNTYVQTQSYYKC
jgi:hypothetical protein